MRRLIALAVLVAVAGALGALVLGTTAQGSSTAQIDAIFDDAKGLVGGQVLKIAGAQAGTIDNVVLTKNYKARIEMTVDSRFMPFRQNATCTILAEGLISENYVECDPGSANSPPLPAIGGRPPTVPVTHTTEPVSLVDLFNIFNAPTRERFTVLVNELGIGTAGEGQNINAILLRANPSLALARQVTSILVQQNTQLARAIDATSSIAASLSANTTGLQGFLDSAAALSRTTANHRSNLALAINRLPGLLAAAQPSLQQLNTVAVDGTPLVQQIDASVPALNRVAADLGPFVATAKPGLAKLGNVLDSAIPALKNATPLIDTVRNYADGSLASTIQTGKLYTNLQQKGFVESFLSIFYYLAAATSRFDASSHMLGFGLQAPNGGLCALYATSPVAGCSAKFGGSPSPSMATRARRATRAHHRAAPHAGSRAGSGARAGSPAPRAGGTPSRQPTSAGTAPPAASRGPASTGSTTTTTPSSPPPPSGSGPPNLTLQGLLNFLLK
jgi:ABC-type transporter Mla subunit MlaD